MVSVAASGDGALLRWLNGWWTKQRTYKPFVDSRAVVGALVASAGWVMAPVVAQSELVRCRWLDNCRTTLTIVPEGEPVFLGPGGYWRVRLSVENTGDQGTENCSLTEAHGGVRRFSVAAADSKDLVVWLVADPPDKLRMLWPRPNPELRHSSGQQLKRQRPPQCQGELSPVVHSKSA
jgi:hypothetical protein